MNSSYSVSGFSIYKTKKTKKSQKLQSCFGPLQHKDSLTSPWAQGPDSFTVLARLLYPWAHTLTLHSPLREPQVGAAQRPLVRELESSAHAGPRLQRCSLCPVFPSVQEPSHTNVLVL